MLSKLKTVIGYALYNVIVKRLPSSESFCGKVWKRMRNDIARLFCLGVDKTSNIDRMVVFSKCLVIGKNSGIGKNSTIQGSVTIGDNVMIGPELLIYTTNHRFDRSDIPMIEQGFQQEKPVIIEDDVWIGGRVTILPGVHIKEGCIIGAGSVVTKGTEPFSVVGGNPARLIKTRK